MHSSKRFAGPTGLEEYVGYGVGMALTIHVEAHVPEKACPGLDPGWEPVFREGHTQKQEYALIFRAAHYFFQLGRFRLRLPNWLTPGALAVTHAELGDGRFLFRARHHTSAARPADLPDRRLPGGASMTTLLWTLIAIQIAMAAFDTIYHHELTERLAWRPSQRHELKLHAARSFVYVAVFIVLGFLEPHGAFAMLVIAALAVEVVITLADFIEEDMSRKLAGERARQSHAARDQLRRDPRAGAAGADRAGPASRPRSSSCRTDTGAR